MWDHLFILFGSADQTLLCSSGWPETLGPPASVSQVLGFWAWGAILGSITSSWCSASIHIPCHLRSVGQYWKKCSYPCGKNPVSSNTPFLSSAQKIQPDPSYPQISHERYTDENSSLSQVRCMLPSTAPHTHRIPEKVNTLAGRC